MPAVDQGVPGTTPAALSGTVGGHSLELRSAVLLWRERADDAQLLLSDTGNLCSTLSQGSWPRESTLLVLALEHNDPELRDAPFGPGEYPVRTGEQQAARDTERATFLVFDQACEPVFQASATSGRVHLAGTGTAPGVEIPVELDLVIGADRLQGRFTATVCPQPEQEPSGCR